MNTQENRSDEGAATLDEVEFRQWQIVAAADTRRKIEVALDEISRHQDFAPVTSGVADVGFLRGLTKELRCELRAYTPSDYYEQKISLTEETTEELYPIHRAARLAKLDAKLGRVLADGADLNTGMTVREIAASYLLAAAGLYLSTYLMTLIGQCAEPRAAASERIPELAAELINALRNYVRHEGVKAFVVAAVAELDRAAGSQVESTAAPINFDHASDSMETQPAEPTRRLKLLRELDGEAKYKNGKWTFRGITKLVNREKADGRKRFDPKTIRIDLADAAQAEREAERAGLFDSPLRR